MTLRVEDGSGVPEANTYVTDNEALSYLSERGLQDRWQAVSTSAGREGLLVQAADFMNTLRWPGLPLNEDQTMALPTTVLDYIPRGVKAAQILLAVEAISGPLMPTNTAAPVIKERKKVDGVGEKEITYAEPSSSGRSFPFLSGLIGAFVDFGTDSSGVQVVRRLVG